VERDLLIVERVQRGGLHGDKCGRGQRPGPWNGGVEQHDAQHEQEQHCELDLAKLYCHVHEPTPKDSTPGPAGGTIGAWP
jgi:hypothetical protein